MANDSLQKLDECLSVVEEKLAADIDPGLEALLRELWGRHGIAALINTSFNGPDEPIVHTRQDALTCARDLCLDGVVIDGSLHRP